MRKQQSPVRYLTLMAMFIAASYVAVLACEGIPKVSGILSYEPKDALIVIAGFIFGPLSAVIVSVLVSLIEMITISTTGPYGLLMNVVSSCSFAVPAAWIYSRHRTQKGAVIGLTVGVLTMAAAMVAWNYIITPLYIGVPREVVAGMLAKTFLPFNLIKGGINAGLAMLVYKPLVTILRKTTMLEPAENGKKGRFSLGFTLFALAVLVTFVLLLLSMLGIL